MNLIDCWRCKNWTIEDRIRKFCKSCNNSGKSKDPNDYLCNMCGECLSLPIFDNFKCPYGLVDAIVVGGYYSDYLCDLSKYRFSFCEKCLRELFNKCKIKPEITDVDFDGNLRNKISWEDDKKYVEQRIWELNGGKELARSKGKCNAIKDCNNDIVYDVYFDNELSKHSVCEEHKSQFDNYCEASLIRR